MLFEEMPQTLNSPKDVSTNWSTVCLLVEDTSNTAMLWNDIPRLNSMKASHV